MLNTIDWQQIVHDPRFWAIRYASLAEVPGVTQEDHLFYFSEFYRLAEDEDDFLAGYAGDGDDPPPPETDATARGWRTVSIPFPENYTWNIELTTEDGHANGIYHTLFHPDLLSRGLSIAEEGGHERLPGLRWAELKQVERCLNRHWQGYFDVRAIVTLLYPVVKWITFDDLAEVRQTLAAAWLDLQVLSASQTEQWLDDIIKVYDHGWVLYLDAQKNWKPLSIYKQALYNQGPLWIEGANGWQTPGLASKRNLKKDTRQFLPFFSMLERNAR
jgi:hypothetical protein